METIELLKEVLGADDKTRELIKQIIENLNDTKGRPYSLRLVKTELPRQSGKTSLALGNALMRATGGERVCLMERDATTAFDVVNTLRSITGNHCFQVNHISSIGRGQLEVAFPSYKNLLGKQFDTIIFDECWETFNTHVSNVTEMEGVALFLGVVKDGGTLIRLETALTHNNDEKSWMSIA